MSRRLSKKIRAGKHTKRSAANLPKLNFSELGFARKRSLRAALMVGTALTTAAVGVVADVVVGGSPAMAACPATVNTYGPGSFPNGIACQDQTHDTTIVTTGTTLIGGNATTGDGIELTAGHYGLFLGVNTGNATQIGLPTYGNVTRDGIHVSSDFSNTTISINNAATIIGTGENGIYAKIGDLGDTVFGNNTISVENTQIIGNATNPAGYNGVYSKIEANGPRQINYVSNTAAVFASHDGIHAVTLDRSDYTSGGFASTTVFNNAYLHAGHEGIHAFTKTTTYEGYYAHAITIVTNAGNGTIVSIADGIHASTVAISEQDSDGENKYGGKAVAVTDITNAAPITAGNAGNTSNGIFGNSSASATAYFGDSVFGGQAFATTAITNVAGGNITSTGDGIYGQATADAEAGRAGNATGGTAGAYVVISNAATITSGYQGIHGNAFADATAYDTGNATGGVANAVVSISNSAPITANTVGSDWNGINGYAKAKASAYNAGNATGGTSEATVVINNSASITDRGGEDGIHGEAIGNSSAIGGDDPGQFGHGGYAAAAVIITNTIGGNITAGKYAIDGSAYASANGQTEGFNTPGTVGTGGSALAVVEITNDATLTTYGTGPFAAAINGVSIASALGGEFFDQSDTFTATGGTAEAYTSIKNTGKIYAAGDGIEGFSLAIAGAFASYDGNKTVHGTATGGYANATTVINNSGSIVAGGDFGIIGSAFAFADGFAYAATGGTASAVVSIENIGTGDFSVIDGVGIGGFAFASANGNAFLTIYGNSTAHLGYGGSASAEVYIKNTMTIRSYDDGIVGNATALAIGIGDHKGYGGSAYASTLIVNEGNITTSGEFSNGINGQAFADANGRSDQGEFDYGHAKGGIATAFVSITNQGFIVSTGDGIVGNATARAKAYARFDGGNGNGTATATGGTALAAVVINNFGPIVSRFGEGIDAFTEAAAGAYGYKATAGVATAFTDVYNGAKIQSHSTGIYAGARAYANAEGEYGIFGSAIAGVASAEVRIQNGSTFNTAGFVKTYESDSPGLYGFAKAEANADGFAAVGGTASAQVYIYNFASIVTSGDDSHGIKGLAEAYATSNAELEGTGGTAYAKVFIDNFGSITTKGEYADGIYAKSKAVTDGYTPGSATAVTVVQNFGSILTTGYHSEGIDARADAYGDASAFTTVKNNGSIVTTGERAAGIFASSYAYDQRGNATAVTRVYNRGTILTFGYNSPGVNAYAGANSPTATAFATVVVTNSGVIHTYGFNSPAILAKAVAGGYSEPASITVNNTYSGVIISRYSDAVRTYSAPTTINNRGYIYGSVNLPFGKTNIFNNYATGIWKMNRNSYFGGNVNSAVNNAGIVTTAFTGTFTLNGLETFNNTGNNGAGVTTGGLVTMINGSAYDRIIISNYTHNTFFNGGAGSRLGVDAYLGVFGHADVLQVGTKASPGYVTGNTTVIVNNTNTGLGGFNPHGIPVAESSGAASALGGTSNIASNFQTATIHQGLFDWNLFFLPKGAAGNPGPAGFNTWFLASTPSATAEDLPRLLTAAQDIWHNAAGVWLDRTADLRDYYYMTSQACGPRKGGGADLAVKAPPCVPVHGQPGPGVWFRAYGDWIKNNGTATASAPGQTLANLSNDVHYTQDTAGVQIGADFAALNWASGTLFAGILGGAENSTVNFNSGTSVHFQGGNIGTYATYLNGSWFADALFLANFMSADFNSSPDLQGLGVSGFGTNTNVQQFGGHLDIGYRFQWNPWFFEPLGTIEVVHTEFCGSTAINCFNNPGVVFANTVVSMDDTSVRGRLGARVGLTGWQWAGWTVEPSVTGSVWETFTGNNVASLTSNGFVLDLNDVNQHRTQGEIGGAVNVFGGLGSPWSAFVKGDYRFASGYSDSSIKGGLRYQWGTGY